MKNLRVGVIGVGYLGQFHAEKYAAMPDVELVGVADADRARAEQIAVKLETQAFIDHAQLLGRVDAVSIAVPTVHHHDVARLFLQSGIHVLLEKPVTVTVEQADELIELADRRKCLLQVGHIERFNPAVTAVRKLVNAPRYMIAERAAPFTVRCTDVNVVLDLMIHDLDIVMDMAGSEPKEISAAGASVITREIDSAAVRIIFMNGAIADVSASRVSEEKKRMLRIFDGDRVFVSDYQNQLAYVSRRGGTTIPELVTEQLNNDRRDTLADEILDFLQSVRENRKPLVTGVEGRKALALASLITRNITQGINGFVPIKV